MNRSTSTRKTKVLNVQAKPSVKGKLHPALKQESIKDRYSTRPLHSTGIGKDLINVMQCQNKITEMLVKEQKKKFLYSQGIH